MSLYHDTATGLVYALRGKRRPMTTLADYRKDMLASDGFGTQAMAALIRDTAAKALERDMDKQFCDALQWGYASHGRQAGKTWAWGRKDFVMSGKLSITNTRNGFVVGGADVVGASAPDWSGVSVAQTPEELAKLVLDWAKRFIFPAPPKPARKPRKAKKRSKRRG